MKSKRIAALFLSLTLAASVSGMTAFAADWNKSTMLSTEQTKSEDGTKITNREVVKFDYSYYTSKNAASNTKVTKTYVYTTASETAGEEVTDNNGKKAVTVTVAFTKDELVKFAADGVVVKLSDLELPVLKEGDAITAGWSTAKTDTVYETQAKAEKAPGFVQPDAEITDSLTKDAIYTLYPVFREKTQEELDADALEEAKAEKVAVDKSGTEISAAKVNVNVKALAEDKIVNALVASGADSSAAALYDITITDSNGDNVTVLDGKTVTVTLERPKIDGNVRFKLYHIDGKEAEEVEITVSDDAITFNNDEFSPYVLTWTIASGASDFNNPATGDSSVLPIIIIAGVALVAIIVLLIVKKAKGGKDDDDDA